MKVSELLNHLDLIAPFSLALKWDNCGLQIGNPQREVSKVLLCLDITDYVVEKARKDGIDLILSHHPLIFSALKSISNPLHLKLIENRITAISLHTNLDIAPGGVNYCLAQALGLQIEGLLSTESGSKYYHLSVIVPTDSIDIVQQAAWKAGAGRIGNYDLCSTKHTVDGSFRALPGAHPQTGEIKQQTFSRETELEFMLDDFNLFAVQKAIFQAHPYETPSMYYFPVENTNPSYGLGLVCKYDESKSLRDIHRLVADKLQNPQAKLWTSGCDPDKTIRSIAICGGSGNSLINTAAREAELFITGDITYHNLLDSRIPIIDAGHLHTEFPVLQMLAEKLKQLDIACTVLSLEEHEYCRNLI